MAKLRETAHDKDIREAFKAFETLIVEAAKKTVRSLGSFAVDTARSTTSFRNTLKERTTFQVSGTGYSGTVQDDRPYAHWLEWGNDPGGGRIYPVKAQALHFFINGQEIFAKSVRAHGPYLFVTAGRNKAANLVESVWERHLRQ